jgi:hypothetical protein
MIRWPEFFPEPRRAQVHVEWLEAKGLFNKMKHVPTVPIQTLLLGCGLAPVLVFLKIVRVMIERQLMPAGISFDDIRSAKDQLLLDFVYEAWREIGVDGEGRKLPSPLTRPVLRLGPKLLAKMQELTLYGEIHQELLVIAGLLAGEAAASEPLLTAEGNLEASPAVTVNQAKSAVRSNKDRVEAFCDAMEEKFGITIFKRYISRTLPERIDRLFRQSALFDDKWEQRADYRDRTIELAVSTIGSVYDPTYHRTAQASHTNGTKSANSCSNNSGKASNTSSSGSSSPPPPSGSPPLGRQSSNTGKPHGTSKPRIVVRPPYRSLVPTALDDLRQLNEASPQIFLQAGKITEVVADETGRFFSRPINLEAMVGHLDRAANFIRFDVGGPVPIFPPMDLARQIRSRSPSDLGFLPLTGIVHAPGFRDNGSILCASGYDKETGL